MLSHQHAVTSLAISIVYVSGYCLVSDKTETFGQAAILVSCTTILGVIVDVDHIIWALTTNFKKTFRYIYTFKVKDAYHELTKPEGYYFKKFRSINHKYHHLIFILHGIWLFLVGLMIFFSLKNTAFYSDFIPFFWLILAFHFMSDIIFWKDA